MPADGPPSQLFPSWDDRLSFEHELSDILIRTQKRIASRRVMPDLDLTSASAALAAFDFSAPQPLESVVADVLALLESGIVHITHPCYFGLFNPNPTFPSQCADRIAGALNPQLATSKTSPAAVAIEAHVIAAFANRAGLSAGSGGHFTSGGSEANFTAMICALTHAHPGFVKEGVRAFSGPLAFYVSRESHLAWVKIALETGIGRDAVRLIDTDGKGQMHIPSLRVAINEDLGQARTPFMVIATAGTTGAGMIDPLPDSAALAREHGLWYHVDAAWGGAVLVSSRLKNLLNGIEFADSITIDAHKWLATTMGCGMVLTSKPAILQRAFDVPTTFMPSYSNTDPYVTSAQWSRRFMGLRLFLSLAAGGWDGHAEHVERSIALASLADGMLNARGWRVVNTSALAVLCVTPPREISVAKIVERVLAEGRVWLSVASYEGQKVIRICLTNGATSREDIDTLVAALERAFQSIAAESG